MSWTESFLGDFLTLKRGHDLPEAQRNEGEVPIVSSSGITGYHSEPKAQAPGVVTGRYGTLGEVFFIEEDYWPLNTALYVVDFRGNHPRFASYFLRNILKDYQSEKAAVPGVNRNVLHKIKIRYPDSKSQARIAGILATYDDLIENNRRRMALLEEAARQLYREWFVRLRFPGHEHTRITNGIPDGWTKGVISDFYDTGSGGTPSRKVPEFFTGNIPWVKTQELPTGFITDTDEKITEEAITHSAARLFPAKTVLVALYGATVGQIGILAMPAATNQACCALFPKDSRASFIHAFLFFRENQEILVGLSAGAAQKNISQQIIRAFEMIMPTKVLMETFFEILTPVFAQWLNLHRQCQELRKGRDLLLPRLMSGEIAV